MRKTLPVRLRDQKALAFLARREEPAFFDEDGVCSETDSTHSLSELYSGASVQSRIDAPLSLKLHIRIPCGIV